MKTTLSVLMLALTLGTMVGCGGGTKGGLEVLDAGAAIDNHREFDLGEIAKTIEFTPLDGSDSRGLVGDNIGLTWTKERFYVTDNGGEYPVKVFDRDGGFVSTLGRYGRGPGEFTGSAKLAADYNGGMLYVIGQSSGDQRIVVTHDATGREVTRNDSVSHGVKTGFVFPNGGEGTVFHRGELVSILGSPAPFDFGGSPDFRTSIGTKVALLSVFSGSDLKPLRTVETTDKGTGSTIMITRGDSGDITSISVMTQGPAPVLSSNGRSLLVKEALSDTLFHYVGGVLEPAWKLDFGTYTAPAAAFGLDPAVPVGDSYTSTKDVFESDRYLFALVHGHKDKVSRHLVFDLRTPAKGFSATGPEGKHGLFLDGVPVTLCGVHDGRLLGYIQAFDLVDRAADLTRDDLRAVAAGLKEDSNPVIVTAELNK